MSAIASWQVSNIFVLTEKFKWLHFRINCKCVWVIKKTNNSVYILWVTAPFSFIIFHVILWLYSADKKKLVFWWKRVIRRICKKFNPNSEGKVQNILKQRIKRNKWILFNLNFFHFYCFFVWFSCKIKKTVL